MVSVDEYKFIIIAGAFVLSLIVFIPHIFRLKPGPKQNEIFGIICSFAGGVFLAVGIVFMMHEAAEKSEDEHLEFPLSYFMAGIGFLTLFFVDQILIPKIFGVTPNSMNPLAPNNTTFTKPNVGSLDSEAQMVDPPTAAQEKKEKTLDSKLDSSVQTSWNLFAHTLVCCITIHEFFEGLGLGVQTSIEDITATLFAVFIHKVTEALAVGSAFLQCQSSGLVTYSLLFIYCCSLSVGIGIGMAAVSLSSSVNITAAVLVGFSSGSFIYIAALELRGVLEKPWIRFPIALVGFVGMSLFSLNEST